MVELKVLGGIDLRDGAGRSLDPVVAQPKRLAFLTYLALAGELIRREEEAAAAEMGMGLAAADGSGQVQDEPSVELADSQSVPAPPELPEPALAVPEPTLAD